MDNLNFSCYLQLHRPITHSGNIIGLYRGIIGTWTDTGENAYGIELTDAQGIIHAVRASHIYAMSFNNGTSAMFNPELLPF